MVIVAHGSKGTLANVFHKNLVLFQTTFASKNSIHGVGIAVSQFCDDACNILDIQTFIFLKLVYIRYAIISWIRRSVNARNKR